MSIEEDKKRKEFYLIIDSKQNKITVDVVATESFKEDKDGRLNIVYYVPTNEGGRQKRNETYDVFEGDTLLKAYNGIETNLEQNYRTMSF
jgi:hypothetical protein